MASMELHPRFSKWAGYYYYKMGYSDAMSISFTESINLVKKHHGICGKINKFIQDNAIILNAAVKSAEIIRTKKATSHSIGKIKTLENGYLKKDKNGKPIESIEKMIMRKSCSVVYLNLKDSVERVLETFSFISRGYFTHATPTIYNCSNKDVKALSSCFTFEMTNEPIEEFFIGLKKVAKICNNSGGLGIDLSRFVGSKEKFLRAIKLINDTILLIKSDLKPNSKRKGSIKIFLPIWHQHIEAFINCRSKKISIHEYERSNVLHYGVLIPDIFMEICEDVKGTKKWHLFDPSSKVMNSNKNVRDLLTEAYGNQFTKVYKEIHKNGYSVSTIDAKILMGKMISNMFKTGGPSIMFIDKINRKNVLRHISNISTSNLCTEILLVTKLNQFGGVCNLSTLSLPRFVIDNGQKFDFTLLHKVTKIITWNLNRVLEETFCPTKETELGNKLSRSIGIGVQGFCDVFFMMSIVYGSEKSKVLAASIFETIYHAALTASNDIAKLYPSKIPQWFKGSPYTKEMLHFDTFKKPRISGMWDWDSLRKKISKFGLSNMHVTAQPPTGSTSWILENYESIDPYMGAFITRRERYGSFSVWDKVLINKLTRLGLWNDELRVKIIKNNGIIQEIQEIPMELRDIHKSVWNVSMKKHINVISEIIPFIDQSVSFNIYPGKVNASIIYSCFIDAWERGFSTGSYYTRVLPVNQARAQVSLDCEFCSS